MIARPSGTAAIPATAAVLATAPVAAAVPVPVPVAVAVASAVAAAAVSTRCGRRRPGRWTPGSGARYAARRMYLGVVTGTVVAERKVDALAGHKLLLVQPLDDRRQATGDVQVAVDTVQAGVGDLVYLVGSREAALALDPWFVPVDAAVVGIVDEVHAPERAP